MIGLNRTRWFSKMFCPILAVHFVVSCAGAPSGHWVGNDEAFAGVQSAHVLVVPGRSKGFSDESRRQFVEMSELVRQRASAALRTAGIRVIEAVSEFEELGRLRPADRLHHAGLTFELSYYGSPSQSSYSVYAKSRQVAMLGRDPNLYTVADIGLWYPTVDGSRWGSRSLGPHPRFETVIAWLQRDVDSILEQVVTSEVSGAEGAPGSETRQRTGKWDWLMNVADRGIIGFIVGGLVALGLLAKAYVKRKLLKRRGG